MVAEVSQHKRIEPAPNPAETYERYMVPPLFAPAAERLLDVARPKPGERVLDVGCGTGIVARHVASRIGQTGTITGLDVSPEMLAVAQTMSEREGVTIDWRPGRAEALPFPDGAFDLALCQFALMFFADQAAALAEMRRVLADGGRVGVSVFQSIARHPFYVALDAAIERRLGSSGVGDIFALGDAEETTTLLTNAGFQEIDFAPVTVTARFPNPAAFLTGEIDVDTAAIPVMQHLDGAARQELVAALRDDMAAALRAVTEGGFVVLPFHIAIARAYR